MNWAEWKHNHQPGHFGIGLTPIFVASVPRAQAFQASLKWYSPARELLDYKELSARAYHEGYGDELGDLFVEMLLGLLARWHLMGKSSPLISAALSLRYFARPGLAQIFERNFTLYQTDAQNFRLEFNCDDATPLTQEIRDSLMLVRKLGASIGIAGVQSAKQVADYAQLLPLDSVRLDAAHFRDLGDAEIISSLSSIFAMASVYGFTLAIGGVNTLIECSKMLEAGFCELQGFFFGEAMTATTVERLFIG
jgi:EAL domain-containing protein (putative c-di-GMP-specific phosphodiesterase class I)